MLKLILILIISTKYIVIKVFVKFKNLILFQHAICDKSGHCSQTLWKLNFLLRQFDAGLSISFEMCLYICVI